jgi:hypothetical protein
MTVWMVDPVADFPHITLRHWAAFKVPLDGEDKPWTLHLAGYAMQTDQGQVCSAVQRFDPKTARCVTKSGRIYSLDGEPAGLSGDAAYVWERWKRVAGISLERDLSEQLWNAIQTAHQRI